MSGRRGHRVHFKWNVARRRAVPQRRSPGSVIIDEMVRTSGGDETAMPAKRPKVVVASLSAEQP